MELVDMGGASVGTGVIFTLAALILLTSGSATYGDSTDEKTRKKMYRRLGFVAAGLAAAFYIAGLWLGAASAWGQA